jgi:acetyl-CoA acetyltransferase
MQLNEDIAIVAMSQTPSHRRYNDSEVSLIMDCVNDVLSQVDIDRHDIDFTIAGSADYLSGMPFAFVANIDAVGAWPPVYESHVEMDGAFAMFEAFVRLQMGDIDTAFVSASGKSSPGNPRHVFPLQGDPYYSAPLGLDSVTMAGLQAQALIDAGKATEEDFAQVVSRSRRSALDNPNAQVAKDVSVDELLAKPYHTAPLRNHDLPPISDGAAAVLLARGDKARELCENPVWITGIDHRLESHHAGLRDLTTSVSTRACAEHLGVADGSLDVAELCVNYSPEEIILAESLNLGDNTVINPSGGPLAAHPVIATGLIRVIEAATRVRDGEAGKALAHCSSGAALQQNLIAVLEGDA